MRGPGEGAFADLVLFDADRIADQATCDNPRQMCAGIERVMLNRQWAFAQGLALPQRAGRFMSHPGRAVAV